MSARTWSRVTAATLCAMVGSSHAGDAVSDADAQAVARQILEDYKKEREKNIPRWATLAHDEGQGKEADCPVPKPANGQAQTRRAVSFKDCNLAYFELREERWQEVLQSWSVLTPAQKDKLSPQINGMFASLQDFKGSSTGSQATQKGYSGGGGGGSGGAGGGLAGLLASLGLSFEDDTLKTVKGMLNGSFLKDKPQALLASLSFHNTDDLGRNDAEIDAMVARNKGSAGSPVDPMPVKNEMRLIKQNADNQKAALAETTHIAKNSKSRADAVKDITTKIQALGKSGEDASLVSAQMAQYEFYLAALDALGREEQIKAVTQKQGEQAEANLKSLSFEAARTEKYVERALKRQKPM
jgi:hypothetical protein